MKIILRGIVWLLLLVGVTPITSFGQSPGQNEIILRFADEASYARAAESLAQIILEKHDPYNLLLIDAGHEVYSTWYNEERANAGLTLVAYPRRDISGSRVLPSGSLLYKPQPGSESICFNLLKEIGAEHERSLATLGWEAFRLPINWTFKAFSEYARSTGYFADVMEDEIIVAWQKDSNDPFYSSCWYIEQLNDKDIDADLAWAAIPAGTAVKNVAVIDGHGFDTAHPDLAANVVNPYNSVDQTTNVAITSTNEKHGTACAGIPGAVFNNSLGTPGLGGGFLKVQPIKIGYNPTTGGSFSTSSTIQAGAINYAMSTSNTVTISMSFGSTTYQTAFFNAITSARTTGRNGKGIVVFGSTGNSGASTWINYPASYAGVIAVGATSSSDARSSFSNYGSGLTLSAPGSGITTTDVSGANGYSTTDYTNFSGTSAACPVAASVGAMTIIANSALTETEVKQILAQTCEKVGGYSYTTNTTETYSTWSNELGYGRVNMNSAINQALSTAIAVPDITINGASVSTSSAIVGQVITIQANQSISVAPSSVINPVLEYRWSTDQTWSSSDVVIGTNSSALGSGIFSEAETISYSVPSGTGTRYILIRCDATGIVTEESETNNTVSIPVTVTNPTTLPDITLSSLSVNDNTPFVGQAITISCNQVITSSAISSQNVVMEYRYSTDASWSSTDVLIGTDTSQIGTSSTSNAENITYTIPTGTGSRYILVRADAPGSIAESNESNNTYAIPVTVSASTASPDITISGLSASATTVTESQSVTVTCQQVIANPPSTPVTSSIEYRWSANQTFETTDLLLATGSSVLSTTTTSENESITFNIPSGVGTYYLLVRADASNVLTESNESNTYSIAFTVGAAVTLPDVFLDAMTITASSATVGSSITVNVDQNISDPSVAAVNVFMEYRWGTSSTWSTSFPIVGVDYSSLGAGDADDPESHTFTVPSGTGQRYLLIRCDSNNGVSEGNESNNVLAIPINITAVTSSQVNDVMDEGEAEIAPEETEVNAVWTIYPNPSSGIFTSILPSIENTARLEIIDLRGAVVKSFQILQEMTSVQTDISDLPSGLYILAFHTGSKTEYQRLLLEH